MEFMLRWWDELDDTLTASRHLLADAVAEFGSFLTARFQADAASRRPPRD